MERRRVLILGGCGFIGRNLVSFLFRENLVQAIRIVDKVPPQVAWLNKQCQEYFGSPLVEFKSANLINPESCKNAFSSTDGWDFVINCAGETKLGQTDPVYQEGIFKLSLNCAKEAALCNVKHYIELSSGCIYSSEKVPQKEDGPVEPWTFIAKWKRQVETQLVDIPNLNYTILRLATVYGKGDRSGLMPRIMLAAIYKEMKETMKLLWDADLRINTVHVEDVCRAIWLVCERDDTIGQIYNVVDDADSSQGSITNLLAETFNLKTGYYGTLVSMVADLVGTADDANDKHLKPWAEACKKDGVQNTPLTPHMDSEVLLHNHLRLDGGKLKNLGFVLKVPKPTVEEIKTIIDDYVKMNVFPHSLAY